MEKSEAILAFFRKTFSYIFVFLCRTEPFWSDFFTSLFFSNELKYWVLIFHYYGLAQNSTHVAKQLVSTDSVQISALTI